MAPRKIKTQGKRNRIKIKSKLNKEKRALNSVKKVEKCEKPIENLKWYKKIAPNESYQKSMSGWLQDGSYKVNMNASLSATNVSESDNDRQQDPDAEVKYSESETSDECTCKYSENAKMDSLRQATSSNSVVASYLQSGMDQVASFIVESAIRFGEQHGVVVPDKDNPNIYEFTPTDKRFGEKFRKIRLKMLDKSENNKDSRKIRWRSRKNSSEQCGTDVGSSSKTQWQGKRSESIEEILPILKKINQDENLASNNAELEKQESESDVTSEERSRERDREMYKSRGKRHKNLGSGSNKDSETEYIKERSKWRKFKRDSLELGRQRLRAASCAKKQDGTPPSFS